jgi:two-component system, cell cycle response regulator DivK
MIEPAFSTGTEAPLVLLVGPDADARAAYHYDLNHFGFRVHDAEDASRALRLIAIAPPDVVVTDLVLGDVDGFTLCRTLKTDAFTSALPILALTGHADADTARTARDAGFASVLVKPCLPERLREEIVGVIAASRRVRERSRAVLAQAQSVVERSSQLRRKADVIHERTARLLQLLVLRAEPESADRLLSIALVRLRGEFQENPGLQGSVGDIARLIEGDAPTTRIVLETLVRAGFLARSAEGIYGVASVPPARGPAA